MPRRRKGRNIGLEHIRASAKALAEKLEAMTPEERAEYEARIKKEKGCWISSDAGWDRSGRDPNH